MNESLSETGEVKILCVDDSQTNLAILKDTFKDEGYRLAFATSGEDALVVVFEFLPDLILLDVLMPGIDGYNVCQVIKENPKTRDIPIIFISGMDEKLQKNLGYRVGAVDYITKPFDALDVQMRVKTQLSLRNLQKENKELKQRIRDLEKH
ncbi:MAG: hypothetical protein COV67_15450 [Nitrospinae bacterium CG11_big_fil_rev_8_21_14_0_20_56_8]|nr:MAG: hypothetical protein COV67_15450 [Nitrospinae bacterium CG11_big_fil_rev_8_21_14_0_20_56_8]